MSNTKTTIQPFPRIEVVPGAEISVGHCVILNDFEKPCGRLLCVITEVGESGIRAKYLNADTRYDLHNKGAGMFVAKQSHLHNLTPVQSFGVRVFYDFDRDRYMCEKTGESVAKYADGSAREWQGEWSQIFNARKELRSLFEAAKSTASEGGE